MHHAPDGASLEKKKQALTVCASRPWAPGRASNPLAPGGACGLRRFLTPGKRLWPQGPCLLCPDRRHCHGPLVRTVACSCRQTPARPTKPQGRGRESRAPAAHRGEKPGPRRALLRPLCACTLRRQVWHASKTRENATRIARKTKNGLCPMSTKNKPSEAKFEPCAFAWLFLRLLNARNRTSRSRPASPG